MTTMVNVIFLTDIVYDLLYIEDT